MSFRILLDGMDDRHRMEALKLLSVRVLWAGLAAGFVWGFLDLLFAFRDGTRVALDLIFLLLIFGAAFFTYLSFRRTTQPRRRIARLVESSHPELENVLVNADEFDTELRKGEAPPGFPAELMREEIDQAEERLGGIRDRVCFEAPSLRSEVWLLGFFIFSLLVLAIVNSSLLFSVVPRFLHPWGDHPPYSATQFEVFPPGATVDYGEDLKVTVQTSGKIPDEMFLVLRDKNQIDRKVIPMFHSGEGKFFQTIENASQDFEYFARVQRGRSKRFPLSVVKSPQIEDVVVTYEYPAYAKLAKQTTLLSGDVIQAYRGTRVSLSVSSNRPLEGGTLTVCGEEKRLEVAKIPNQVTGTFLLQRPGDFEISLLDFEGNSTKEPFRGKVGTIPDEKPRIAIVAPGMDSFAVPDAKISIAVEADDDLGLARITLFRNHNGSDDFRKILFEEENGPRMVSAEETLDLEDLGVRPGDVIDYYAAAADNRPEAPQTTSTQSFRLQIVSYEEFREFMQAQMTAKDLREKYDAIRDEMGDLLAAQRNLLGQTEQLAEQARREAGLTPPQQDSTSKLREEQADLEKWAKELAERLNKESRQPGVFDVEKDYKKFLQEFSERLLNSSEHMQDAINQLADAAQSKEQSESSPMGPDESSLTGESAPSLDLASQSQQEAIEALEENMEQYEEGIAEANEQLENLSDVIADIEKFKYLYTLQKGLERQIRYYKDLVDPGIDERIRLKELSEQQSTVRGELSALKEEIRRHANALDLLAEEQKSIDPSQPLGTGGETKPGEDRGSSL